MGKAIKESGIDREKLFLCSKVWTTTIEKGEEAIRARLDQSELCHGHVFARFYIADLFFHSDILGNIPLVLFYYWFSTEKLDHHFTNIPSILQKHSPTSEPTTSTSI